MNIKYTSMMVLLAAMFTACSNFKVTETAEGDRYQIHEEGDTDKSPKVGDFLKFNLKIVSELDSVFTDTWKQGGPIEVPMQEGQFKGSFENALKNLNEGDSATVYVPADSIFSRMGQPLPPGVPVGSDLKFIVKLLKVQSQEEYAKVLDEKRNGEAKLVADFAKQNLKEAVKMENGMYYSTEKVGTGATVAAGDTVTVSYVGKFFDGNIFDQNNPFTFPVGMGYVIKGWDVALMSMKVGQKSTFVIPSELAYGDRKAGPIDAFTPLVFDIELLEVKKK